MICSWPDIIEPKLKTINLELTAHCNLSCWFCLNPSPEFRKKGFISEELIQKIEKELDENTKIMICGIGEPALHPHFGEILERLCKKFQSVSIVSNGFLLQSEDLIEIILKNKVEKLFLSLDYIDEASLSINKNAPKGYLDEIFKGLKKLEYFKKKYNKDIFVQVNFLYDGEKEDEVFIHCHEKLDNILSGKWCMYVRMIKSLAGQVDINLEYIDDDNYLLEKFSTLNLKNIVIESWNDFLKHIPGDLKKIKSCRHIYSYYMLLWDGRVVPCCNDFNGTAVITNVLKSNENLNDLFYSKKYKKLREELDDLTDTKIKICQNCSDFYKA